MQLLELIFFSLISFSLAYAFSFGDLAFSKYPLSYQIAARWRVTKGLYLYGLMYGIIAVLLFLFTPLLWYEYELVCTIEDGVEKCLKQPLSFVERLGWNSSVIYSFACGLSTKGLTKFSPIDIPSSANGTAQPINFEQLLKHLDRFITQSITLSITSFKRNLIIEIEQLLVQNQISLSIVKERIKYFMPELKAGKHEEVSKKIEDMESVADILRYFSLNFNISHLEEYRNYLQKNDN